MTITDAGLGFANTAVLLTLTRETGKRLVQDADRATRLFDALEHEVNGAEIARIREALETCDRSVRVSIRELVRMYPDRPR